MGSTSVGIEQTRTTLVVAIDEVGKGIVRYGLVLVLVWIDGMKFTSYVLAVGFSCLEVGTRYIRPGYAARILVSTEEQEQQGLEPHELVAELGWKLPDRVRHNDAGASDPVSSVLRDGQQGTEATAWHKVVLELNRRLVVAQVEATRSQIKIHAGNCLGDLRASSRDFLSRAVEYHSGRGSRVYSSGI